MPAGKNALINKIMYIPAPANPLALRLGQFCRLSQEDVDALAQLSTYRIREISARDDLVREGDPPQKLFLVLDGWAGRYKTLEDGRRQIVSFFVPGDLCDLNIFILREMDHSVGALSDVRVAEIGREELDHVTQHHPRITQGLWWQALVNMSIQREWTLNLGQRTAFERLAHTFCELFSRLQGVGLTKNGACDFPLTQSDLADANGLTSVHTNRTLQRLRSEGLLELKGRMLRIPDLAALQNAALFNTNYLHLNHEGRHLDANG